MRVVNVANEELEVAFEEAFESQVASRNNIPSFDVAVEKNTEGTVISVETTVYGFAGTPTQTEYEANKGAKKVEIQHPKLGKVAFKLDKVYSLNVNDYVAIYKFSD